MGPERRNKHQIYSEMNREIRIPSLPIITTLWIVEGWPKHTSTVALRTASRVLTWVAAVSCCCFTDKSLVCSFWTIIWQTLDDTVDDDGLFPGIEKKAARRVGVGESAEIQKATCGDEAYSSSVQVQKWHLSLDSWKRSHSGRCRNGRFQWHENKRFAQ